MDEGKKSNPTELKLNDKYWFSTTLTTKQSGHCGKQKLNRMSELTNPLINWKQYKVNIINVAYLELSNSATVFLQ